MGMLIYIILRRLCLDNEQNATINLKNDVVKNIQKPDDYKKIPSILALKKYSNMVCREFPGRYNWLSRPPRHWVAIP